MIKLYFDIYFEFLKNSRFFWKSVYMYKSKGAAIHTIVQVIEFIPSSIRRADIPCRSAVIYNETSNNANIIKDNYAHTESNAHDTSSPSDVCDRL
jgi:hypothetical protein